MLAEIKHRKSQLSVQMRTLVHLFHFWRDNDDSAQPRHGPKSIGVIGFDEGLGPVHVSLIESNFQSDEDVDHGNFEVVACRR
jgi:hypothetical protein